MTTPRGRGTVADRADTDAAPTADQLADVWLQIRSGKPGHIDEAFDRLWRWYNPLLLRFARSRAPHGYSAEELVSDTWIRIYWHCLGDPHSTIDPGRTVGYLLTTSRNLIRDYLRRPRREVSLSSEVVVDTGDDLDHILGADERRRLWSVLHDRLPPSLQALLDRKLEGMPRAEFCSVLGITVAAYDQRMNRLLKILRATVEAALLYELTFGEKPGRGHL